MAHFLPAREEAILREQFDYLVDHAHDCRDRHCSMCDRFDRMAAAVLEIFGSGKRVQVHGMGLALTAKT
mgnify:CR=1 FL=1